MTISGLLGTGAKTFGFTKAYRLTKTDEFSSVFRFGRPRSGKFWQVYFREEQQSPRVGIVVAKKVARRAVQRNLIKRIAREVFRLNRTRLVDGHYVVRCRAVFTVNERQHAWSELQRLLGG